MSPTNDQLDSAVISRKGHTISLHCYNRHEISFPANPPCQEVEYRVTLIEYNIA